MASMLQSAFVTALRHRSATDPDGVTKEISAMLAPRSRIFKTLSLNDRTHLFVLHTDLTIGPVGGSGPSTRSRTRRNLLPVWVFAFGGVRPPPISVSQPAPKRRRQVVPPVEVPPALPSPPVAIPALAGLPPSPVPDPVQLTCHHHSRDTSGDWLKWELLNDDVVPAAFGNDGMRTWGRR